MFFCCSRCWISHWMCGYLRTTKKKTSKPLKRGCSKCCMHTCNHMPTHTHTHTHTLTDKPRLQKKNLKTSPVISKLDLTAALIQHPPPFFFFFFCSQRIYSGQHSAHTHSYHRSNSVCVCVCLCTWCLRWVTSVPPASWIIYSIYGLTSDPPGRSRPSGWMPVHLMRDFREAASHHDELYFLLMFICLFVVFRSRFSPAIKYYMKRHFFVLMFVSFKPGSLNFRVPDWKFFCD